MLPPELERIAADARAQFREFLASESGLAAAGDLLSAEELVYEFTALLGLGMEQDFVDVVARAAVAERSRCGCGLLMEVHRRSVWTRKTLNGTVSVCDAYVYCRGCGASAHPVQARLGTERETWSLLVQEAAVDLASDESCGNAVDKLARHHPGVDMGRTTALRLLHGKRPIRPTCAAGRGRPILRACRQPVPFSRGSSEACLKRAGSRCSSIAWSDHSRHASCGNSQAT